MQLRKSTIFLLTLAVALLVATQLTRPSTELALDLDGSSVRYRIADNTFEGRYEANEFKGISIKRSVSAVSETSVEWIKVGDELILSHSPSLFFGGRLYGALPHVESVIPFRQTFGDWSLDRFEGPLQKISKRSFSAPFKLTAQVTGRGSTQLVLHGTNTSLVATIRSGLMDNDLSLCILGAECLYIASFEKPLLASLLGLGNTLCSWGLLATILVLCVKLCSWIANRRKIPACTPTPRDDWPKLSWALASLLALVHFCIAYNFGSGILGGVPHIPDSVVYMEQARTLAYGLLDISFPPNLPHDPFYVLGAVEREGAMTFWYNRFWPFLIAVALRGGFEALLLPLLSAGTVVLLFSFSSATVGRRAALLATTVYSFSPFTITQAGDFMTHVPTSFFILATIEALRVGVSRNGVALFITAGACGAFAFGIRPLTTLALAVASLVWFLPLAYAQKRVLRSALFFLIGACPLLLLLALDNYSITGEALVFPHARYHSADTGLTSLPAGAMLMDSHAAVLSPILFATPVVGLSVALALVPLLLAPHRRVLNLLLMPLSLLAAYHLWPLNGLHGYGPRFLFEATPYLCTLIGLGIVLTWDRIPLPSLRVITLLGALSLFIYNAHALYRELPTYEDYNQISAKVARDLERISKERSIVLVGEGLWQNQGYANMWLDPTLSDFVAIRALPEISWEAVIEQYPHHKRYSLVHGELFHIDSSGNREPFEKTE